MSEMRIPELVGGKVISPERLGVMLPAGMPVGGYMSQQDMVGLGIIRFEVRAGYCHIVFGKLGTADLVPILRMPRDILGVVAYDEIGRTLKVSRVRMGGPVAFLVWEMAHYEEEILNF